MRTIQSFQAPARLAAVLGALLLSGPLAAQSSAPPAPKYPALPSEMPARFEPTSDGFDYARREAMIAMRDGVKLHTVILVPTGARRAPILLTRTPYDATRVDQPRAQRAPRTDPERVRQRHGRDRRGRLHPGRPGRARQARLGGRLRDESPHQRPQNPTPVDHATDTYDTIDWLVKNVPESNGKVGILGISYDGFLPLMALVNPHPALKVSVPMNPMVDGWMGDDWFHNGAFREQGMSYIYEQEATRKTEAKWWRSHFDDYDEFLQAGRPASSAAATGSSRWGSGRSCSSIPPTTRSGATRPSIACSRPSRSTFP